MADKKTALVIMAAGMGSRFGGLKQLTAVGPAGELIIDYSIFDAKRAGFDKVYFIIKEEIVADFKEIIGDRISKVIETEYIMQELNKLPEGFSAPEGRTKPYGTGHAIWCGRDIIKEDFVVINADDYYGPECFKILHDFLINNDDASDKLHMAMAGFILKNTVSKNGYTSRGICEVDDNGMLTSVTERTRIEIRGDKIEYTEDDGETWVTLDNEVLVSMNCWAFPQKALDKFNEQLIEFLNTFKNESVNPLKAEFYLPSVASHLIDTNEADIKVLKTNDQWYGMTYHEDLIDVKNALAQKAAEGIYPKKLWN